MTERATLWRRMLDRVAPPLDPRDAPLRRGEVEDLVDSIAQELKVLKRRVDELEARR